jgi:FkbM family methyltransferase
MNPSPYRSSDDRFPYLVQQTLIDNRTGEHQRLIVMMLNIRSENWYGTKREDQVITSNHEYLDILKPGMRVMDLGANEGYTTILAAAKVGTAGRVMAVDAAAHNIEPIKINVSLNGFTSRVDVIHAAVADIADAGIPFSGEIAGVGTCVTSVTVDTLASWFKPDVIKIDIEGYEVKALRGASDTLRNVRPIMFLEPHLDRDIGGVDMRNFGDTPQDLFELLRAFDYGVFAIGGERMEDPNTMKGAVYLKPI